MIGEEKFRAIVETAAEWLWEVDQEGLLSYSNPAVERILGFSPAELVGSNRLELLHPDDRQILEQDLAQYLRQELGWSGLVLRWRRKQGGFRYLEGNAVPILDRAGELRGYRGADRDVTDRREAEALQSALYRISERTHAAEDMDSLYRGIHEIVGELMCAENFYIALYDPGEGVLRFPYFVDQVDAWPGPRKLGKGLTEYVLRAGRPLLAPEEQFESMVERGEVELIGAPSLDWLGVPLRRGTTPIGVLVVQSYSKSVRFGEREKEVLTFVSQHIAAALERQRAKESTSRSLSLLQSTLESTTDGILVVDRSGKIVSFNRRFAEVWRLPGSILAARDDEQALAFVLDQLRDPEEFLSKVRELYARPEAESFDVLNFKDGRVLERYSIPQRLDGVAVGRVWSFRDVTERKELEAQLRQSQKLEAVGRLAGGVAHDFNNLLGVILGHSELLLEQPIGSGPVRRKVQEIQKAAERGSALTRQLLAFSRKQRLQVQIIDVNAIIAESGAMLRRLIGEDIELVTELEAGLGLIEADGGQIEQVIMNLAVNARDAMPQGGRLNIRTGNFEVDQAFALRHPPMKVGSYVQVVVSDTGTGIDVAIQPHIFEPFFTTKEIGKGTGLGLATVYGIVRQSGGTVWVHSEPNHGTVFEIYLPRTTATAAASAEESQPEAPRLKFETVLLVEDERALRELTCECLEAEGYEVLGAQDGQQALEICQRHQGEIDLLVSDVVMPGISGPELAQRLLKLRPRMKVMLVSGYSDEVISARSKLELGMAFIQKPCPPSEFRRRVRELLDAKDDRAD